MAVLTERMEKLITSAMRKMGTKNITPRILVTRVGMLNLAFILFLSMVAYGSNTLGFGNR